jgi:hypothetical protein
MVAYSFKRRFVEPIRAGLGLQNFNQFGVEIPDVRPKRQTIRADRRRHARPGEMLQFYCAMRTKSCFLIGRAHCVDVQPIYIEVEAPLVIVGEGKQRHRITTKSELNEFARADGFGSYEEFGLFWYEEHHDTMNDFYGVIIKWKPLSAEEAA